ncbi:hypothetical protein AB0C21_39720 [Spirillospora sp. NPDC049024]
MSAVFAVAATSVLGVGAASVGTASADTAPAAGTWRAYGNTNPITSSSSTWKCTDTINTAVWNIKAQLCAVRSASRTGVQTAVIVRNNGGGAVTTAAYAELWDYQTVGPLGRWKCSPSGVARNSWSVCFGKTIIHSKPVFASNGYVTTAGRTIYFPKVTPDV